MVRISCIMGTARDDYAIDGMPDTHIFEPTIRGLKRQEFNDFELVISDELYRHRKGYFDDVGLPFAVKHIPAKPSAHAERGMYRAASTYNTCLTHADGELMVVLGDCMEFLDNHVLEKYWQWYEKGYFTATLFTYYRCGRQLYRDEGGEFMELLKVRGDTSGTQSTAKVEQLAIRSKLWRRGDAIKDTRWDEAHRVGVSLDIPDSWFYGYVSYSLEAALKVNGYDELFDGDKGLTDCDLGSRLKMAGYRLALDPDMAAVEHWHKPASKKAINYDARRWKSNYALYKLNKLRDRYRANSIKLTDEDVKYVRRESIGWDNIAKEDVEQPVFDWWVANQPVFDLREMRMET